MTAPARKTSPMQSGQRRVRQALRIAKHSWRDLKREVQKNAFKALEPKDYIVLDALRRECIDPYYFIYIWPEKKVTFIEVPKCASSHVLTMMGKARNGLSYAIGNPHIHSHAGLEGIASMGIRNALDLFLDPAALTFSFVRNPYDRALSCYLDKFADCTVGDGSYLSNVIEGWWSAQGRPAPVGRPLTLTEFCRMVSETAHIGFDGHWATQDSIIPKQSIPAITILKFENIDVDLPAVFSRAGVDSTFQQYLAENSRKPRVSVAAASLTPEQRSLLRDAYRVDFERFDYPA